MLLLTGQIDPYGGYGCNMQIARMDAVLGEVVIEGTFDPPEASKEDAAQCVECPLSGRPLMLAAPAVARCAKLAAAVVRAAVASARLASDPRSSLPILASVRIRSDGGALTFSATDLSGSVFSAVGEHAPIDVVLDAKRLESALSGDGEVSFASGGATVSVSVGERTVKIAHLAPVSDWPKLPNVATVSTPWRTLPHALVSALASVVKYVSRDGTRLHLNGAYFEQDGEVLRVVATDGHRMIVVTVPADGAIWPSSFVLARREVEIIARLATRKTAEIAFSDGHAWIRANGATLAARFVEVQFPPWQQVVPRVSSGTVKVDGEALREVAARMAKLAGKDRGIVLTIRDGALSLSVSSDDANTEETLAVDVATEHGPVPQIGLCARYLVDAADACGDGEVTLRVGGCMDPVRFDRGERTVVVMPMRM